MENSNENPIRRLPAFESRVLEAMEFGFGFLAMSKNCTEIQEIEIEGKTITWKSKNYVREKEKEREDSTFFSFSYLKKEIVERERRSTSEMGKGARKMIFYAFGRNVSETRRRSG